MGRKKTFTSSINSRILATLNMYSRKYNTPKNKIIEEALSRFFDGIHKTELRLTFEAAKHEKRIREFPKTASTDVSSFLRRKR